MSTDQPISNELHDMQRICKLMILLTALLYVLFYFIFFFSEHQALTNDVYLIDGNHTSPTANHTACKYIYTSQQITKFNLLLNLFKAAFLFVPYLTQDNKKFQTLQLTINNIIGAFQLLTKPIFS